MEFQKEISLMKKDEHFEISWISINLEIIQLKGIANYILEDTDEFDELKNNDIYLENFSKLITYLYLAEEANQSEEKRSFTKNLLSESAQLKLHEVYA